MTTYVGEYVRIGIEAQIQTAPGVFEPLADTDVDTATITIWDSEGAVVVDEPLVFDDGMFWYYDWDTVGQTAGKFKVRALYVGPGNRRSWEYGTVKLVRDLAPVIEGP